MGDVAGRLATTCCDSVWESGADVDVLGVMALLCFDEALQ